MWITFKICIFVTSNNRTDTRVLRLYVVNYFQNLYLCDFQQQCCGWKPSKIGCELLSKFVSLWLPTTTLDFFYCIFTLWITFKICIFVTSNNFKKFVVPLHYVVNYFQNLYLCDFQQPQFFKKLIFCLLSQDIEKRKPSVPISLENKREGFSFPNIV